jgi:hypothetical protein
MEWHGNLTGPLGSPYENIIFHIGIVPFFSWGAFFFLKKERKEKERKKEKNRE